MTQAGFEKRFSAYGATTLYGEYGRYNDMLLGYAGFTGDGRLPASVASGDIAGTEVSRWGIGAVQQFDAASMEMYAVFNHFDTEIRTVERATPPPNRVWRRARLAAEVLERETSNGDRRHSATRRAGFRAGAHSAGLPSN